MKTKHTQGKWEPTYNLPQRAKEGFYNTVFGDKSHTDFVAKVFGNTTEEANANTKLIAAAPELLEALQNIVAWANIKDGSPSQYLRDAALAVIKKATE